MIKYALRQKTVLRYLGKRNLSQNSLALRLGISSAYMSQMLTGKRNLSPGMRSKILEHFAALSFEDLFKVSR
jgi:transcriptional regulator with XRE-family HTH domain